MRSSVLGRFVVPALVGVPRARLLASAAPTAFDKLQGKLQTITRPQRLSALANWDQLVMMPQSDENHAERGQQLAALAGVVHAQSTSSELGQLIEQAVADGPRTDARDAAMLREAERDYSRQGMLTAELAERQRALRNRYNQEFHNFTKKVEEAAKNLEFDIPYRELGFYGQPNKSINLMMPCVNALVDQS